MQAGAFFAAGNTKQVIKNHPGWTVLVWFVGHAALQWLAHYRDSTFFYLILDCWILYGIILSGRYFYLLKRKRENEKVP